MGAASYPTLASAQSDMIPVSCILGGLLLFTEQPGPRRWAISKAGALFGIAVGLKLTAAPYCVAGVVALLLAPDQSASARCRTVLAFGAAGVAAAALVGGPWWLTMYIAYGNPILPSMNQLFHSPFVDPLSFTDERFQPRTWAQALAYPFYWAATPRSLVSELAVRDPRFAMAYVALTIVLLRSATSWLQRGRRLDRTATMLVAFFIASFVVWEALFSYLRYLAPLELLVGAVVLLAVQPLLAMPRLRVPAATVVLLLCAAGLVATIYPDWGLFDTDADRT